MSLRSIKPRRIIQTLTRYLAEVIIIFVGITISFLFDQWRTEQQNKKDLTELSQSLLRDISDLKSKLKEDLDGSATWINQLDSLRIQRTSSQISERQLNWFFRMISGQIYFLFEPHSPTYLSAANSSLYSELPDSLKNDLYNLYQVRLPLFELLYEQQRDNVVHFRNTTLVPSGVYLFHPDAASLRPDLQVLAREIARPAYGNFINETIIVEKEVYQLNESSFESLTALENSLSDYIERLKNE